MGYFLLFLVPASLAMKEMKEYLDTWNWDSECWGEANVEKWMKMEESLSQECLSTPLNEGLRMAPLKMPKMGSPMRYQLANRHVIDDQYNIQMDFLKTGIWQMKDLTAAEHLSDPVWREKMSQSWTDCAEIAQAMPESALDNCPIARMFGPLGRSMKFLMCKKFHTEKNCAMAQAEKLQRKYHPNCLGGTGASVLAVRDKYEEALACSMTLMHGKMEMDSTAKFVHSAIRGEL